MIGSNNLQSGHWCDDPTQCEAFLTQVGSRIVGETKFISRWYKVERYQEDIAEDIKIWFLQQMQDKNSPFAEASFEEATNIFLGEKDYRIRGQTRLIARKISRKQAKEQPTQAEILAGVRQPELALDEEKELRRIAESIPRIESKVDFTSREIEIFGKETLRQTGIGNLPDSILDEVAQIAGVFGAEQRAYNQYHDKNGKNSDSDRKAYSRAKAKVKKVFDKVKLMSLLAIVFTFSLGLFISVNKEDSGHQKVFVSINKEDSGHQKDFISQNFTTHLITRLEDHQ